MNYKLILVHQLTPPVVTSVKSFIEIFANSKVPKATISKTSDADAPVVKTIDVPFVTVL